MPVSLNKFGTKEEAARRAGLKLRDLLQANKGKKVLLLSSGGSAFLLLDQIEESVLTKNITVSVLDERFCKDPLINNFLQLRKLAFYIKAKEKGCKFIDTSFQNENTLEEACEHFESALRDWRSGDPNGVVIATQGIGEDGHTSGIMPFPENPQLFEKFFQKEAWVKSYDAEGKNPYPLRVTTTITFLKEQVDEAILFVSGDSKKEVVKRLIQREIELYEMPSQVIWEMKEVEVYTEITF